MDLNKYLVDASTVGNWGGQDQLAADNLNRIYKALHLRISPILIVGKEQQWDPEFYDEIMSHVRDAWMDKDRLLALTDEQIDDCVAIFRETRNGSIRFRKRKIGDEFAFGGPRSSCVRQGAPLRGAPWLPQ